MDFLARSFMITDPGADFQAWPSREQRCRVAPVTGHTAYFTLPGQLMTPPR
jgi:hypothetical protein